MGELRVPAEALWGAQTQRAVDNFPVSGRPLPRGFIRALGLVKAAAAEVNAGLGLLPKTRAAAIRKAATDLARMADGKVIDVLVLAGLYTWRIMAGAVVAEVALSNWLLAFSMFLFLSLALVKRCAELEEMIDSERTHTPGRGYLLADLATLRGMGMASGFLAVMVLALYIDSQNGKTLYPAAEWLWGLAPLLLAWVMRIWLKVARRELRGEDPVAFALKDRYSWVTLLAMGGFAVLASKGLG